MATPQASLATVLERLAGSTGLSETRRRDLRSAVRRVAELLGNVPAAIPLAMETIQSGLKAVNPVAVGMTSKRFTNIRSDFVAAVKASGLAPIMLNAMAKLSREWIDLFSRLGERRAHVGLSRLARYASSRDIQPKEVNDKVIKEFITAVREGSLHQKPKALYRQVTLIWNKAAADPNLRCRL